jgi:hypothetical protein
MNNEKTYEDGVKDERQRIEQLLREIAYANVMPRNNSWMRINIISLFIQLGLEKN